MGSFANAQDDECGVPPRCHEEPPPLRHPVRLRSGQALREPHFLRHPEEERRRIWTKENRTESYGENSISCNKNL